jgi:anti-sigma B factor antagonist
VPGSGDGAKAGDARLRERTVPSMPAAFAVDVHVPSGTVRVLAVTGELDLYSVPELKDAVGQAMEDEQMAGLVIDLTDTTFVDSTGLGLILSALARMRERTGRLVVVNTEQATAMTFAITGLDQVLCIVASRDEALSLVS